MKRIKFIVIPVVFFILGAGVVYFFNLNWILAKQTATRKLINNFRKTYDLQEQLRLNYSYAYDQIVSCTVENPKTCNYVEVNTKLDQVKKDRDQLKSRLEELNNTTQLLIKTL